MDMPFGTPSTRTMYEETMSSIKTRLPKCVNAGVDLFNRINFISNTVDKLKYSPVEQNKFIEDNLYYLSRLNYQLKRLVA